MIIFFWNKVILIRPSILEKENKMNIEKNYRSTVVLCNSILWLYLLNKYWLGYSYREERDNEILPLDFVHGASQFLDLIRSQISTWRPLNKR